MSKYWFLNSLNLRADFFVQFVANWFASSITPSMRAITEMIHGMTKSKETITILNQFGACISYDSMKRVDVGIANYIIQLSAGFRCPLGLNIKERFLIQLAIDNFNHKEWT